MKRAAHRFLTVGAWRVTACLAALLILSFSTVEAQAPDRTHPPELGAPPSLKLPPIIHKTLSNGLRVILMEKHQVPLVQVDLIVMSGAVMDPPSKSGLASITAAMMEEGAGSRNSLQLADAIDFLGAGIDAWASQHTSGVSLHTPLSKLDSALALFGDVALRPTFPPEELDRLRTERLTSLMQWHDEPQAIASVEFAKVLFGVSHPYGRPTIGNEASLRSFSRDDLRKYHDASFHPDNAFIVVVGDVIPDLVLPKLESIFGAWRNASVEHPALPAAQQVVGRSLFLVDKPGAPQSEIRIGRIGAERLTADYYPLRVMNTILGGSFTSRLNQNLREQHGYTYGAESYFDLRPTPGPFVAAAAVQTDVTDKALPEFMIELERIRQPVSDEELDRARKYLTLRYPENFQSVAQIAGQLGDLVVYGLPDETFNNYTKKILAVTKEDVERVARKYIDPENVDIVIVGDRNQIEKGIAALNLGPIQNLTIDEVLGPAPVLDSTK